MAKTKKPVFKSANQTGSGTFYKNPAVQSAFGLEQPPVQAIPTFEQILANDPFYLAALGNLQAAGVFDKSSRDQAIKQAMVRFGFAPGQVANMQFPDYVLDKNGKLTTIPKSLADILDPATRSLGEQNTKAGLSIWARIQDAADQQQKRTTDVLGSRGMFRSGETGYQLKRGALAADQQRFDATNKLMDFLSGAQSAYVSAEMQRQAMLLQLQRQAAEDAANNPPPGGGVGGGSGGGGGGPGGHLPPQPGKPVPGQPGTTQPWGPIGDPGFKWNPGPSDPGVPGPPPPPPLVDPYKNFQWGQTGGGGGTNLAQ